jgi:hypothetical protein
MRWFKHMTKTWDDEKIAKAVELGGLEAYGLYFRLLEIVAGNMEPESKPECEYSVKRWARDCGLLSNRFQRVLKVLAKCKLLSEIESDGLLKVEIPNIAKYRDEYSDKRSRRIPKSPDTIPTESRQCPEQDTDTDTDTDINTSLPFSDPLPKIPVIKKADYSQDFEKFWAICPNKKSKGAAVKSFAAAMKKVESVDVLLNGMAQYAKIAAGKEPKYIKHPSTWLNQECWNDEHKEPEPKKGTWISEFAPTNQKATWKPEF